MAATVALVGGAGGVGSSAALNLLLDGEPVDVVLVDRRPGKVASHVMDLEQVLALGGSSSVRGGSLEDLPDADVVVICAATQLTGNASRMTYLAANADILGRIAEAFPPDWGGALIVVTNPVDPLVTWLQERTGLDRGRVLGYTLNDSLRLRTGIARALGAEAADVDAWVLGEHGDASVPIFSHVRVRGRPIALDPGPRHEAADFVRGWYRRHVALDSGRSSTWTSGLGVARMALAIVAGAAEPWVASTVLEGEYGISGVAIGVPVRLGGGAAWVEEWELADEERAGLEAAAAVVRGAALSLPT
jgi:malate dehydrogenase